MLVDNSVAIAKHAWSVRLMMIAALMEGLSLAAPSLLPYLAGYVAPSTLSAISLCFILAGVAARFIKQTKVSG